MRPSAIHLTFLAEHCTHCTHCTSGRCNAWQGRVGLLVATSVMLLAVIIQPLQAGESSSSFDPVIEAASDQGEKAMAGFSLPEPFQVQLFAAEPMLANPVALSIDPVGRVYVVESFRYGNNPESTNLEDDLACQTVADRLAMHRRKHGEGVENFTTRHDRVRLLVDTDGDGRADRDTVFADQFNRVESGPAAGVLALRDEVLLTCIPDLWRLRDSDQDGKAEQRNSLSHGYGVHVGFRGHDMHGPLLHVDGRIYFTIGDRGLHVETPEGVVSLPHEGAVLRCNRDGSGLEIFHSGLRNPQDLCADDFGNLFTGDNNSDGGDKARLVHVLEGGNSGWHMGWQYMGEPDYRRGPWNAEGLWHLPFAGQAADILPAIAHIGNGPSGVAFYPGTGLSDEYRGKMFLCDYNGSAARTGVYAFGFRPAGASFEIDNLHRFLWGLSCSDVAFGPNGLYVADWAASWNPAGKGRVYRVFNPQPVARAAMEETENLLAAGMQDRNNADLIALLAHADRRVRLGAQLELTERGDDAEQLLLKTARSNSDRMARLHAIWGLGILGRQEPKRLEGLLPLLQDPDAEIRSQCALVLGDAPLAVASRSIASLLGDPEPRVQMYAAIALGKLQDPETIEPLLQLLRDNNDHDPYLRYAAVSGLAGIGDRDALLEHAEDPSSAARLGILLALRRMGDPAIARFLEDSNPRLVTEAARAIYDTPIQGAEVQLADALDAYLQSDRANRSAQPASDALLRRLLAANYRGGSEEHALRILRFLQDEASPLSSRREAARMLAAWQEPSPLDRVVGLYRPLPKRDPAAVRAMLDAQSITLLESAPAELREPVIDLLASYEIDSGHAVLTRWVEDGSQTASTRIAALGLLAAGDATETSALLESLLKDADPEVRIAAGAILAERHPERAAALLVPVVDSGDAQSERQKALAALSRVPSVEVDVAFSEWLSRLIEGNFPSTLQLDLVEAASQRDNPLIQEKLKNYRDALPSDDPLAAYRTSLHGGDYARGRELFIGRMEVKCLRCHKVKTVGGSAGPPLSRIGVEKSREYLLESIVLPSAQIAKGYETTVITTDEGRVVSGIVQSEDEDWIRLLTPERQSIDIAVDAVDDRYSGKSAMPEDMHKYLDAFDLRDLVEFLYHLGRRPQDQ
ncbi:MAG: PVC-type heme-binding CxxCH protein [Planctomycetota bacterium]|nr:PVC-type heme-binding CxxCH protein [Planctomycetota bacterium]